MVALLTAAAIKLETFYTILAICGILLTAISVIVGIYIKLIRALDALNSGLEGVNTNTGLLTKEIAELKEYRIDIDKNKSDIQELKLQKVDEGAFNKLAQDFNTLNTQHKMHHGGA